MATSSIPAFTAALKAALEARPGLAGVAVTDGLPAPGSFDGAEWVALLDVEFERQQAAVGNAPAAPRHERYTLTVAFSVRQTTRTDQTSGVERAFALFAELEQLISADQRFPAYAGPGELVNVEVDGGRVFKRGDGQAREAWLEADVRVWALI